MSKPLEIVTEAPTENQIRNAKGGVMATMRPGLPHNKKLPDDPNLLLVVYQLNSLHRMATIYGVSKRTIRRRLARAGIQIRRRGRPRVLPTDVLKETYRYIEAYFTVGHVAPTEREIGEMFGITSTGAGERVRRMEKLGWLKRVGRQKVLLRGMK